MGWFFDQSINEVLQNFFPEWFEIIFKIITYFGEAIIYIVLLAIAYWILNKKDAIVGFYILFTSSFLNTFLKLLIKKPRPNQSIRLVDEENFNTPSGHAQTSSTVYGWMTFYFKKIWMYIVIPILVLLICLSRVYLGVHYIGDVIIGLLIGLTVLAALYFGVPFLLKWIDTWSNKTKIIVGETYAIIIFLTTFLLGLYTEWPEGDVSNTGNIVAGLFLFPIMIWIETKWIKMKNENIDWQSKLLRAVVGLIILIGAYFGLSAIFDLIDTSGLAFKAQYSIDFLLRFVRYSLLTLIVGLLMPWIFVKVKIFSKEKTELEEEPAVISSQA